MMGTYGTCWDILQILPWQITIKPPFVEHILILSNHLKQIWQVINHCFPLPFVAGY